MWHLYIFLVLLIDLVIVVVNLYNFAIVYIFLNTTTYSLSRSSEFRFFILPFPSKNKWMDICLFKKPHPSNQWNINGKKPKWQITSPLIFFFLILTETFVNNYAAVPLYFRGYSRGPSSFESRLKRWNTCIIIQQVLPKGWYTEVILMRLHPAKQTDLLGSNRQMAMYVFSFSV